MNFGHPNCRVIRHRFKLFWVTHNLTENVHGAVRPRFISEADRGGSEKDAKSRAGRPIRQIADIDLCPGIRFQLQTHGNVKIKWRDTDFSCQADHRYVKMCSTMQTGKIFDIKKYAIHDGPGIRTTVFFKGCPLSCRWCHNPEGIRRTTQRIYRKDRCIGCGECADACPASAVEVSAQGLRWKPSDCLYCGICTGICPGNALEIVGQTMSVDEVMAEITKDTVFYDESGGGITISGGEPLMQPAFLMALLDACGELELHRTLDTSGYADTRYLLDTAARTELFLYDLKHMDADKHIQMTGVSNEKILSNLEALSRRGAQIVVRIPIVPGINSDAANIDRTGAFVASLPGVNSVNILPYHSAAKAKYNNMDLNFRMPDVKTPSRDFLESIAARLETFNLYVKIGG